MQSNSQSLRPKIPRFCKFLLLCYASSMNTFRNIALKSWLLALMVGSITLPFTSANAGPNCTCRANGKDYNEGQLVCLTLPSGPQLSRCERVLNNTSWKKMADGCPSASLKTGEYNFKKDYFINIKIEK